MKITRITETSPRSQARRRYRGNMGGENANEFYKRKSGAMTDKSGVRGFDAAADRRDWLDGDMQDEIADALKDNNNNG